MGNISKQMKEVIANTQYDATEQVWEDSDDSVEAEELENLEKLKKKHGKK
jgi:DNA transposition AAA+ family ATPase